MVEAGSSLSSRRGFELAERRGKRVQSELRRMRRRLRQAADCRDQGLAVQRSSFVHGPPGHQFGQSRGARHRRHASLGLESNFRNASRINFQRQTKYVSTSRILDLRRGVSVRNFPRVARILKMIKQLSRVHTVEIVNA